MNSWPDRSRSFPAAELSFNARRVLEARYLRRDEQGRTAETPEQLFARVASAVAAGEALAGNPLGVARWREAFEGMLASLEFLPNSPTLMNAGLGSGQLSACFVLPVPDTMEGIFDGVRLMALVQRTGGGTGFSFSRLRPRGDLIGSTGGEAAGPVAFMKVFDSVTEQIKQGGRRRGANMGVLRVDHPDILEFVEAKRDGTSLRNFNLSVGVTDAFMQAVEAGTDFSLVHPGTGGAVRLVPAREVFDRMVECAWGGGDPGILFLDAINRANPTARLGLLEATNPCGEVPLLPYEACNLGSIQLPRVLLTGGKEPAIDWGRLRTTVRQAVRFLDDVIEVNRFPSREIAEISRANRKLGLGVMGFAETLIRLGVSYDSDAAVELAERIMREVAAAAVAASEDLAAERGVFSNWAGSRWEEQGRRVRNATLTAIAPTGTIGILAGTTPGIEPLFALAYRRVNVLEGATLVEVTPWLASLLEAEGADVEAARRQLEQRGVLGRDAGVPEGVRRLLMTATEIPWRRHLEIQAAFQRHTDNSVSKTINLPREATREDVAGVYRRAFELGLKGVTVYRWGSRSSQVLELGVGEVPGEVDHATRCDPGECRL